MGKRYSQEVNDFVRDNVTKYSARELAEVTNEKFGTSFTDSSMKSFKSNRGLKGVRQNTTVYSETFPKEIAIFIQNNCNQVSYQAMADLLKRNFGRIYTKEQIRGYYRNHGLRSGIDGKFKKGRISPTKGKKGLIIPGSEKGWFKAGNKPHNAVEVGTEIIDAHGYHKTKIAEPDVWIFTHKLVWKQNFGDIQAGMRVSFKDCNKDNLSPDNLMLITNTEHIELVRRGLRFSNPEHTEIGLTIARMNIMTKRLKRKQK